MVIVNFELDVVHLQGQGLNAWHISGISLTHVYAHNYSKLSRSLKSTTPIHPSHQPHHQPTTPQYNPHLPHIQWLNHLLKIRVNRVEPLVLITAVDVLMAEGARVAQSQHLFLPMRHQVALRQMQMHSQKTEKTRKTTQPYKLK